MESLQIQLSITRRSAAQGNLGLDRVLARGEDEKVLHLEASSMSQDTPVLDGKQPKVLRS